jgi:hypothetical protein
MRTGIYTKIILTIIATMLIVIAFKPFIASRHTTYFREPDAKTLLNQAVEDMTAVAERNDDSGGRGGAGPTGSAPNSVASTQVIPQNTAQQGPPEPRSETPSGRPAAGESSKQLDDDPHSEVARQNSGTIDRAQPTDTGLELPDINRCLGHAVIIEGSPQFRRLDNTDYRAIESARRGGHPKVPEFGDTLPPNPIVAAVLKKPTPPGQLDSRSDFIRSGRDGVTYVLVEVKAGDWEKGWVGWMERSVFDKGIHAPGEHPQR